MQQTFFIEKDELAKLFDSLSSKYTIIGPRINNDVIVLDEITYKDIPAGFIDTHGKGYYHLKKGSRYIFFFGNGPDSLKRFLHKPNRIIHDFQKTKRGTTITSHDKEIPPLTFFGVRACDIRAVDILRKVFYEHDDSGHEFRKTITNSLIIAINCIQPGENCFCTSVNVGPEIKGNCDIAITELRDGMLLDIYTDKGRVIIDSLNRRVAENRDLDEKREVIKRCRSYISKTMKVDDLPGFLYQNLDFRNWQDVSERCLACGNCTQVCPTCFCNSTFDYVDLSGIRSINDFTGQRVRVWDSCFSKNFARVHGGNFRPSRWARYRHWLNHKLGYWLEQFGVIGCVGCGRCITWCPVGIDITEELQRLRR